MWESSSLTVRASTVIMQSVCSPIVCCWDSMRSIDSNAYSSLGKCKVGLLPTEAFLYSSGMYKLVRASWC